MKTVCASPLICKQPPAFVNAHNKKQKYAVIYKDEGGKYTRHYPLELSIAQTTRKVSLASFIKCNNPACSRHIQVYSSPEFASDTLFQVEACNRSGFRGPLRFSKTPVSVWRQKANVWSFETFNDVALEVHCKFQKVSCKVSCPVCSGLTQFVVAVATDDGCIEETLPVVVKSKRKIPASMRNKSQREINAYKAKSRSGKHCLDKKTNTNTAKRRKLSHVVVVDASKKSEKQKTQKAATMFEKNLTALERQFLKMTDKEKVLYVQQKEQRIQQLETELKYVKSVLDTVAKQGAYVHKPKNFSAAESLSPLFGMSKAVEDTLFVDTNTHPFTVKDATVPEPITSFFADIDREPMSELADIDLADWDLP